MYSKFKLVRILQNLFFRLQNTQIFLQKCPSYCGAKYDVEWFVDFLEFQKYEGKRKTFVYEKECYLHENKKSFPINGFARKPGFETEARGTSGMAY